MYKFYQNKPINILKIKYNNKVRMLKAFECLEAYKYMQKMPK